MTKTSKNPRPASASKVKAKPAGRNELPVDGVAKEVITATAEKIPLAECHVNGVPFSSLPERAQQFLGREYTDEGIAEKNAKRVDSKGVPHSGIKVLLNEGFDQIVRKRASGDAVDDTDDPLLDAKNRHEEPGFRYRGLGPAVIKKKGMRNWEAVTDAKGDLVTAGNLILARMPIARAEKRNKKYRDEGNANAAAATERFNPDHEDSALQGSEGVRVLRPDESHGQRADAAA